MYKWNYSLNEESSGIRVHNITKCNVLEVVYYTIYNHIHHKSINEQSTV